MNKKELVSMVATKTGLNQKDAGKATEAVFETIAEELEKGEKVQMLGFGTFETRKREARQGRNPHSGEPMEIAASVIPAFKAGAPLKERVNHPGKEA